MKALRSRDRVFAGLAVLVLLNVPPGADSFAAWPDHPDSLVILHTNDIHAHLLPFDDSKGAVVGGAAARAAQIARLIELAKQLPTRQEPAWNETHIRQQLAQLAIEAKALQVTRLRGLTRRLRGEPPGPEGSILKLFGSELGVRIADFASTLLGPYAMVDAPTEAVPDAARWFHRVLGARQYTIAGGTSEIQRNIIGERVLGLPKG